MSSDSTILFLAAFAFSVLSVVLQHTLGNRSRVQAIQKEMNELQKGFQKAAKEKDEKELKRLEEKQKHMMNLMFESMRLQFKPMLVILPLFILLFGGFGFNGFLLEWFQKFSIQLPIALHFNSAELLGLNLLHASTYGPRGFFIVVLFFTGLALQLLVVPTVEKFLNAKNKVIS